ncbi:hypothetical protein [Methylomonas sp. TEB]|uniref:hypothetical protein n=1 Tax=Methylomonas sp. TEB TaxID=3398229 RepID=UPI0039F49152
MKELFTFLLSYPIWVKVTIVILVAVCALLLVVFKPQSNNQETNSRSSLVQPTISVGTNAGGIVAGRDVHIQAGSVSARTDELIRMVSLRAQKIAASLAPHYEYATVSSYLSRFQSLHESHVDALRRGSLIEAHEIVCQIHDLSRELQSDEFWTRHNKETPDVCYSLNFDAFQRGPLIEWYVEKQLMEELVAEKMHSNFSWESGTNDTKSKQSPDRFYEMLVASSSA